MPSAARVEAATSPNSATTSPAAVSRLAWQSGSKPPSAPPVRGRRRHAQRGQGMLGQTLGVVDVDRAAAVTPRELAPSSTHGERNPARLARSRIPAGGRLVRLADLEHAHVAFLAARVDGHDTEDAVERMRPQIGGVLAQWIEQRQRLGHAQRTAARSVREAGGHRFHQADTGQHAPQQALLPQPVRLAGDLDGLAARQRRRDLVVAPDADDLLGEIVLHRQVAPEARHLHVQDRAALAHGQAQPGEDAPRVRAAGHHAEHALDALHAQPHPHGLAPPRVRVQHPARDRAAGQLGHELRRPIVGVQQPLDVGAALEAIGGVGAEAEGARGAADASRDRSTRSPAAPRVVPALTSEFCTAHHAGQADGALRIRDDEHRRVQRARLAVERGEALARGGAPHDDGRIRHARRRRRRAADGRAPTARSW